MFKTPIVVLILSLIFTSQTYAQEPLLPEPDYIECEDADEPLNPDSSEARRLLESDDADESACAQLRIGLHELQQADGEPVVESLIESVPGVNNQNYMQNTLLPLLTLLRQLLGGIL